MRRGTPLTITGPARGWSSFRTRASPGRMVATLNALKHLDPYTQAAGFLLWRAGFPGACAMTHNRQNSPSDTQTRSNRNTLRICS